MIWFVAANTNSCRIFVLNKKDKTLTLVDDLLHPESKLKSSDITSDRPGHYATFSGGRGAYVQREDPKEIEIDVFAREIAKALDQGRRKEEYQHLILAAQPHMNGLIQKHLDVHVKECITHYLNKDYTHLKNHELFDVLQRDLDQ